MPRFGMCRNTYMLSASIKHESFQCSAYFNNRGKENAVKLYHTARTAGTTTQPPNPTDRPPRTTQPWHPQRHAQLSIRTHSHTARRRSPSDPRPPRRRRCVPPKGPSGDQSSGSPVTPDPPHTASLHAYPDTFDPRNACRLLAEAF